MSEKLSEEQIEEYKEVFKLFDENGDETINTRNLGTVMRLIGESPTETEIQEMIYEVDAVNGTISFQGFLSLLADRLDDLEIDRELYQALKVYAKENLDTNGLRNIIHSLGEKISDKEIDEMFREADVDGDGLISYSELVRMIIAKSII